MPQININEIDESIYTRVNNNNLLRVLVPGIATFGPVYDGTDFSLKSFTNKQDFRKVYGYTLPEQNPIKNEFSKIYAEQLLDNGAEVSFVRLNDGIEATFSVGDPATSGGDRVVPKSVYPGTDTVPSGNQYKFCKQIKSIKAKYSGSFGNHLLITIQPVNSVNRAFTYQYANITVYKADFYEQTNKNANVYTTSNKIKSVTKLESRVVTTNPYDTAYVEDVEFDFITIELDDNAREEFSLIWSNLNGTYTTSDEILSGFPTININYVDSNTGKTVYNAYALLGGEVGSTEALTQRGWDFKFSEDVQNALKLSFAGVAPADEATVIVNTNKYIYDCYCPYLINGKGNIVASIYDNLNNLYKDFVDPYIFDFDFITSGTLLSDTYTLKAKVGTATEETVWNSDTPKEGEGDTWTSLYTKITAASGGITTVINVSGDNYSSTNIPTTLNPTHIAMLNLVTTRQDCIALIDPFENWLPEQLPNYVAKVNSSFATMHAPHCYVNSPVANQLILMPPSYIFLMTELNTLISSGTEVQKWFAPAGVTRATARMVVKPKYEIGSVLLNVWQNDNLARVNPIMRLKSYGYVIYGNYTCRVASDVNSFSALDSLNVRITANCVKQQIFTICMQLTFEPNNSSLWMRFYDAVDKYLMFMKRNDGVYDYKIQMDESTVTTDDINQLRCPGKVWINPTRTAEFFDIDFTITEAGVTFANEIGEAE